jgi:hypothetical protein
LNANIDYRLIGKILELPWELRQIIYGHFATCHRGQDNDRPRLDYTRLAFTRAKLEYVDHWLGPKIEVTRSSTPWEDSFLRTAVTFRTRLGILEYFTDLEYENTFGFVRQLIEQEETSCLLDFRTWFYENLAIELWSGYNDTKVSPVSDYSKIAQANYLGSMNFIS